MDRNIPLTFIYFIISAFWTAQYGDDGGGKPKASINTLTSKERQNIRGDNARKTLDQLKKYNRAKLHIDKTADALTTPIKNERDEAKKRRKMLQSIGKKSDDELVDIVGDTVVGNEQGLSGGPLANSPETTLVRLHNLQSLLEEDDEQD